MHDIPRETAFLDNDIDVNLVSWEDLFLTCVDQFIPKIRIQDPNRPPWIDADVLHLIRKKERVRRKARITDSPYQWRKFRKIRSEVKKLIKFNKLNYIDKLGNYLKSNQVIMEKCYPGFIPMKIHDLFTILYKQNTFIHQI